MVEFADPYLNSAGKLLADTKMRFEAMKTGKAPWIDVADLLAQYILGRKNYMTQYEMQPQDYFDSYLFDTTAISANHLLATSNVGALWPSGAKTFTVEILPEMVNEVEDTQEIEDYFIFVTKTLSNIMDNPKAGFLTTLEEYMIEQTAFGTSGIIVEEQDDLHVPVLYRPISFRDLYIDMNGKYQVDTVYIKRCMTAHQIRTEYGMDSFAYEDYKDVNAIQDPSQYKKYEIVIAIQPREKYDPSSPSNTEFPISSVHIDYTRNKLLKVSGYKEMPVFVGRFWHALNELYGRCPGTIALPDIRELNQLRYDLICASEKLMFPPVSVIDGCILGNGVVDLSAKGLNVLSISGKMQGYSGRPIEQTIDVQDPKWAFTRIQDLVQSIKNHFFLDRIMDLNNETRMTLGEANIRNQLRGQSLNTIYTRQEKEVLEPAIERTFNICLGKGLLGVAKGSTQEAQLLLNGIQPMYIPDALIDRMMVGKDVYKIRFISPASQIRNAQELAGIEQTLQSIQLLAQADPTAVDNLDANWTFRRMAQLDGAPSQMIKSMEAVTQIRQQREQQQQMMMQAQMLQQGAQAAGQLSKVAGPPPQGE